MCCPAWRGRPGLWANRDDIAMQFTSSMRADSGGDAISSRTRTASNAPLPPSGERNGRSDIGGGGEQSLQLRRSSSVVAHASRRGCAGVRPGTRGVVRRRGPGKTGDSGRPAGFPGVRCDERPRWRSCRWSRRSCSGCSPRSSPGVPGAKMLRSRRYQAAALGRPCGCGWGCSCRSRRSCCRDGCFAAAFAMMIPSSIAGVIVYKMGEVRRAARWPSAQGRIVRSEIAHGATSKTAEGARRPRQRAGYQVRLFGRRRRTSRQAHQHRGDQAGQPRAWRRRSNATRSAARGRSTTTRTTPRRPCWSAIRPPAPRTMYAIAAGVMLVGFAVVGYASSGLGEIIAMAAAAFPARRLHSWASCFSWPAGCSRRVMMIASLASARAAARWPTDARNRDLEPGRNRRRELTDRRRRSHHGGVVAAGRIQLPRRHARLSRHARSPSAPRSRARAISPRRPSQRYPAGATVTVHYRSVQSVPGDPGNGHGLSAGSACCSSDRFLCGGVVLLGSAVAQRQAFRQAPPPSRAAWCAGS